jgi:phosphoglycerate dehydrogenase-like enzyme
MKRGIIIKNDLYAEIYGTEEIEEIASLVQLVCPPLSSAQLLENPGLLARCDVVMTEWGSVKFDEELLGFAPELKAVFYSGGSIKSLVSEAFWERGIKISSAAEANSVSVAQYTLSYILSCAKQLRRYENKTRAIRDFPYRTTYYMPGTYNSALGIISLGSIARKVCQYVHSVTEMNILAYDPYVDEDEAASLGVEMCSLEDIFSRSDIVSLHTPVLEETKGLITAEHFEMMKSDSAFINTARGVVVREDEMIDVLRRRRDITAVLDVTEPEPPMSDSPLYDMKNVILTPHLAGCMGPECKRMSRYMIDELKRFVNSKPLKWQITRERSLILA